MMPKPINTCDIKPGAGRVSRISFDEFNDMVTPEQYESFAQVMCKSEDRLVIGKIKAELGPWHSKISWFLRGLLGLSSVWDYSTCWFSSKFFDVHDYKTDKGGDGTPSHFHEYTCSVCGKRFTI